MVKCRIVLKVPATLYAYYDVECESAAELETRLQDQAAINEIVAEQAAVQECSEVDEDGTWLVDEIGSLIRDRAVLGMRKLNSEQ
jgi:hypothetical protein